MDQHYRSMLSVTWLIVGFLFGRRKCLSTSSLFLSHLRAELNGNGIFMTNAKSAEKQHAIIVPYRNRTFHLMVIEKYLGAYLLKNFPSEKFSLWIVEQGGIELFNRGWLANVGISLIEKLNPNVQCIIFHDVDLIPKNNTVVPYNKCHQPVQLGSELQHWSWGVPYKNYAGGVVSMNFRHWKQINGFSNDFEGWGGEDDDLFERLRVNVLLDNVTQTVHRPKSGEGAFETISEARHNHPGKVKGEKEYQHSLRIIAEMKRGSPRWKSDGLSDLTFQILDFVNISSVSGFWKKHHLIVVP